MSRLVFRLPDASRPGAVAFVRLDAQSHVVEQGDAQMALLPRAARSIGVWPAEQVTLLGLRLPPMPAQRLQAALAGALEDRLLADVALQHLAAGPREADGSVLFAACCDRALLAQALEHAEQAGRGLDGVVPEPALLKPTQACLQRLADQRLRVLWRDASGEAAWLHVDAGASAAAVPRGVSEVFVEPGLEDVARRWFGSDCALRLCDAAQWLARAADSAWDLRQFGLAPRAAAQRAWDVVREQAATAAWRRVGWLAATLAALQLLGLNLHALQLARQRTALEHQLQATVARALPGSPAILDPDAQLRRALDQARQRVGAPTSDGLEALMGQAAQVLQGVRPRSLDYSAGKLQLRLGPGEAAAAARRCASEGLDCSVDGDVLRVRASG